MGTLAILFFVLAAIPWGQPKSQYFVEPDRVFRWRLTHTHPHRILYWRITLTVIGLSIGLGYLVATYLPG